jgi:excisionase family DNA binding protein
MNTIEALAPDASRQVQRPAQIPPRLLDITDSARYLAVSDKVIRELIVNGELPFIQRIPGRSPYLLDRIELDKWIERNKRTALE